MHLQSRGSCKQQVQITTPQPTQVLLDILQAQCLHAFMHIVITVVITRILFLNMTEYVCPLTRMNYIQKHYGQAIHEKSDALLTDYVQIRKTLSTTCQ